QPFLELSSPAVMRGSHGSRSGCPCSQPYCFTSRVDSPCGYPLQQCLPRPGAACFDGNRPHLGAGKLGGRQPPPSERTLSKCRKRRCGSSLGQVEGWGGISPKL